MLSRARSRGAGTEGTRQQIVLTAERLFGEHGLSGVSLRKISEAAAQGNNNAVQYHFENKEGLVAAILAARAQAIEMKRHSLLLSAAKDGKLDDVATLLSISYLPLVEIVDERGRHTYARFVTQFLLDYSKWKNLPLAGYHGNATPAQSTIFERLSELHPHIPAEILAARQRRGSYMVLSEVVAWDNDPTPMGRKTPLELAIRDVMAMIVGGFSAIDLAPRWAPRSIDG